jgi:hypothetical protein
MFLSMTTGRRETGRYNMGISIPKIWLNTTGNNRSCRL